MKTGDKTTYEYSLYTGFQQPTSKLYFYSEAKGINCK